MDVPIILRDRKSDGNSTKVALSVSVDLNHDSVADVLEKVSASCKIPQNRLHIILGGCRLQPTMPVQQLQLGPSTSLLALVVDEQDASSELKSSPTFPTRSGFSSFFVHCKNCKQVNAAKLRVHCSQCNSTSIQVQREPQQWADVLVSGRIPSECFECTPPATDTVSARFEFKCVQCNEPSAVLQHLRLFCPSSPSTSREESLENSPIFGLKSTFCCICLSSLEENDSSSLVVDLRCGHLLCMQCFPDFVRSGIKSSQFSLHPSYGFTITCPSQTCKAVVKDPHHFALAGKDTYSEYKSLAVEAFVAADAIKCAHCDIAFIWDPSENEHGVDVSVADTTIEKAKMIACPFCLLPFCALCRREPCTCEDEEAANRLLLEATTRRCPRCDARTERSGGCAHIKCIACGEHWCFVCVGRWTEECQWNHWFS